MNWLPSSEFLLRAILNATWQAALLVLVVYLLLRWTGYWISPPWRVALWAIPIFRLLLLVLPVFPLAPFPGWWRLSVVPKDTPFGPRQTDADLQRLATASAPVFSATGNADQPQSPTTRATASPSYLAWVAILIWFGGVLLSIARWVGASLMLRRILSQGSELQDPTLRSVLDAARRQANLGRAVQCVVTEAEVGPATCGLLKPKIILSKRLARELSPRDWELLLIHEFEHIRRLDCLMMAMGRLAVALHWFNPLAFLARRAMQREMEMAVDAATIADIGPARIGEYGELLLRLVRCPMASPNAVPMASSGGDLRRRINRLVRWKKSHWSQHLLGAAFACILGLLGLLDIESPPATAQESARGKGVASPVSDQAGGQAAEADRSDGRQEDLEGAPGKRASGRVLDAGGLPVPNAQIFAEVFIDERTRRSGSAKTDANGKFSLAYPALRGSSRLPALAEPFHTWVYAEGHGIRVVNVGIAIATGTADDIEIRLPPRESIEFVVCLPDGEPCVDAVVRPRHVEVPNGVVQADETTGLTNFLPELMNPLVTRRTDRQGRVIIEAIPLALLASVEVETPTHGKQSFSRLGGAFAEPLRLGDVGRLEGQLNVESPQRFAGTKVYASTKPTLNRGGLAEAELDERGRFEIPAIAAGPLSLRLAWDPNSDVHPSINERQVLRAGETLELTIDVRPTVAVRGRILTADTREPVRGALISHRHRSQGTELVIPNFAVTDEAGRYATRLAAGEVARQVIAGVGPKYAHPRLEPVVIPGRADEFEIDEILVHPK